MVTVLQAGSGEAMAMHMGRPADLRMYNDVPIYGFARRPLGACAAPGRTWSSCPWCCAAS